MRTHAVVWQRIVSTLAEESPHRDNNGVAVEDCLTLAKIVGPCRFMFYADEFGAAWCRINWEDGSDTTIGLEDTP